MKNKIYLINFGALCLYFECETQEQAEKCAEKLGAEYVGRFTGSFPLTEKKL